MISDYRMPNLNGCELCTQVKELNGDIKLILTSDYDSIDDNNDDDDDNNKLNFELLRKSFTIQKLLDRVNACLYNNTTAHHYQRWLDEI
jgi:DNA-binding NtrC family response regulator